MDKKIKHQKHTKLERPNFGDFHRHEWAFIGTNCGAIQELSAHLIKVLQADYHLAYVDADHAAGDSAENVFPEGVQLSFTDKINFHRYDFSSSLNSYQQRPLFNGTDGVLINGNHFKGNRQIVILDPKKKESLSKKLDRLTNVCLILTTEDQDKLYPFLKEHIAGSVPQMMPLNDINGITQWLKSQLTAAHPELKGLVLAGGKSTRMGEDKGAILYHQKPQREYLYDLLQPVCQDTFYSFSEIPTQSENQEQIIYDSFVGLGPFGALLSAFRASPNTAWLVVACDLPLIDADAIAELLSERDTSKLATAFYNSTTGWPDPLFTIWEPRAYPVLLQFLAQGYSCPRKVLINSEIKLIQPNDPKILINANNPQEKSDVMSRLKQEG